MLSPEVWNFHAPRARRSVQLAAKATDVQVAALSHPYYHSISLVCPDEYKLPDELLDVTGRDNDFYRLTGCPPTELINQQFIQSFIKKGNIACLSINRHCDVENCIAITEDGIFVLHIVDKLYQELGLEGIKTSRNFFDILIDLKTDKLKSQKYYRKLNEGLQKLGSFDFIIKWTPHTDDICPSSIAKYFYDKNITVSISATRVTSVRREVGYVPRWCDESLCELVEWVGMVAVGAVLHPPEPYVSCYTPPSGEEETATGQASLLLLEGFFTPKDILNMYHGVKKYNKSREETHWTALSFQSFTDAPAGRADPPITQFQAADSTYTIFIRNSGDSIYKNSLIK